MQSFDYYLENLNEFGTVAQVNHPIAIIKGLPKVKLYEVVLFETGQSGQVFALNTDTVEIVLFSQDRVAVGTKVVRTDKHLTIGVGKELLGNIINPLGEEFVTGKPFTFMEERPIEDKAPGIAMRSRIKKPLLTGIAIVDMMIPLGKGQKELVIGDRKTGKTSFLFTTLKNQILSGSIAIYAAVGKKNSDIKHVQEILRRQGLLEKTVIVATTSNDSPSQIYITPYTAMTIAEYFRDQGEDVLVVFDDITTHARFYREISLLLKNFPGRDSYPGDIFYAHARLLERAGNFKHPKKGEVAITCLPVVETIEADITNYIGTTLMGITDGHILFDSNIFYHGRRPAINIFLSVTRVGKQTQSDVKRSITRELNSFLALYDKMLNLSHFGAELTDNVKNILSMGEKIQDFFEQHYSVIVPEEVQLVLFSLLWLRLIDPTKTQLHDIRMILVKSYEQDEVKKLFHVLVQANTFNELLRNVSVNKEPIFKLWGGNPSPPG